MSVDCLPFEVPNHYPQHSFFILAEDGIWGFCLFCLFWQMTKWEIGSLPLTPPGKPLTHVSVQSLSHVQLFVTPWTGARQASLSITNFRSLLKHISIQWVMPSNHLIPVVPFSSHFQSFPASGSFPISQFFVSGGQRIGASASVLLKWIFRVDFLRLIGLISLQSKGLSRVFSNTTVQEHQFFGAQLSLWSNSHTHTWPLEKT